MSGVRVPARIADMTAHIPHPYPDGLAEEWIASHEGRWASGSQATFAITLKESGLLIGAISAMRIAEGEAQVGYWIGVEYWNHGYCTEACEKLVEFCAGDLKLAKLKTHHLTRNPASGRVMQKCGFKHVGSGKTECGYRKEVEDIELYEWEA